MIPQGFIWDWDRAAFLALNGDWGASWDTFWWLTSQAWFWIPLYAAFVALAWRKLGWKRTLIGLALVVVGLVAADQIANLFKNWPLTSKFRPTHTDLLWNGTPFNQLVHTVNGYLGGNFGTVSGHAATTTAIAITSAGICRNRWYAACACIYVLLTCFSRIYLGMHFPMDIIFGVITGTLMGLLMLWFWQLINNRWPVIG